MKIIKWTWDYLNSITPYDFTNKLSEFMQEEVAIELENENFNVRCFIVTTVEYKIWYKRKSKLGKVPSYILEGCFKLKLMGRPTRDLTLLFLKKALLDPVAFIMPYITATRIPAGNLTDNGGHVTRPDPNSIGWAFPATVQGVAFNSKESPVFSASCTLYTGTTVAENNWRPYTGLYKCQPVTNLFLLWPQDPSYYQNMQYNINNILWVKPTSGSDTVFKQLQFSQMMLIWTKQNGFLPADISQDELRFSLAFLDETF